ncbi:hypothetical protein [Glycomyces sp. NPDC021274]|uniref:hypothetical protein n=1 Tax=Glycomyces sp. NPDC021274 TaxID=3155120 RepID=UPI0033EAC5FF
MKKTLMAAGAVAAVAAAIIITVLATGTDSQTCQDWSAEYGLTDQAVVVACQTGQNAEGDMTEAEYQAHLDQSLNDVKRIIDTTGGL